MKLIVSASKRFCDSRLNLVSTFTLSRTTALKISFERSTRLGSCKNFLLITYKKSYKKITLKFEKKLNFLEV